MLNVPLVGESNSCFYENEKGAYVGKPIYFKTLYLLNRKKFIHI